MDERFKNILGEFAATIESGKYKTLDEALAKFPEFQNEYRVDKNVLGEFAATIESRRYGSLDDVLVKFPELSIPPSKQPVAQQFSPPPFAPSQAQQPIIGKPDQLSRVAAPVPAPVQPMQLFNQAQFQQDNAAQFAPTEQMPIVGLNNLPETEATIAAKEEILLRQQQNESLYQKYDQWKKNVDWKPMGEYRKDEKLALEKELAVLESSFGSDDYYPTKKVKTEEEKQRVSEIKNKLREINNSQSLDLRDEFLNASFGSGEMADRAKNEARTYIKSREDSDYRLKKLEEKAVEAGIKPLSQTYNEYKQDIEVFNADIQSASDNYKQFVEQTSVGLKERQKGIINEYQQTSQNLSQQLQQQINNGQITVEDAQKALGEYYISIQKKENDLIKNANMQSAKMRAKILSDFEAREKDINSRYNIKDGKLVSPEWDNFSKKESELEKEKIVEDWNSMSRAEQISTAWKNGVLQLTDATGGIARYFGNYDMANQLTDAVDSQMQTIPNFEYDPKSTDWWISNFVGNMPFTMSMIPFAVMAAYGGAAAAGALGLGGLGTAVLSGVSGATINRPLESTMELGGTMQDAYRRGLSLGQAEEASEEVFRENLKLWALDALQLGLIMSPARGILGKMAIGTFELVSEGAEELKQGQWQINALARQTGDPIISAIDFAKTDEGKTSMLLGVATGALFSSVNVLEGLSAPKDYQQDRVLGGKINVEKELSQAVRNFGFMSMFEGYTDIVERKNELIEHLKLQLANGDISQREFKAASKQIEVSSDAHLLTQGKDKQTRAYVNDLMQRAENARALANQAVSPAIKSKFTEEAKTLDARAEAVASGSEINGGVYLVGGLPVDKSVFEQVLKMGGIADAVGKGEVKLEVRNDIELERRVDAMPKPKEKVSDQKFATDAINQSIKEIGSKRAELTQMASQGGEAAMIAQKELEEIDKQQALLEKLRETMTTEVPVSEVKKEWETLKRARDIERSGKKVVYTPMQKTPIRRLPVAISDDNKDEFVDILTKNIKALSAESFIAKSEGKTYLANELELQAAAQQAMLDIFSGKKFYTSPSSNKKLINDINRRAESAGFLEDMRKKTTVAKTETPAPMPAEQVEEFSPPPTPIIENQEAFPVETIDVPQAESEVITPKADIEAQVEPVAKPVSVKPQPAMTVETKKDKLKNKRDKDTEILFNEKEKKEDKVNLDPRLDLINIFKNFRLTEGLIFDQLKQAGLEWRSKIYEVDFDKVISNLEGNNFAIDKVEKVRSYIDEIRKENKKRFETINQEYEDAIREINTKYDAELAALESQSKPVSKPVRVEKEPVKAKPKEKASGRFIEKPIKEISTDEARFQNREGLNEDHVKNIADNWDDNQLDPIVIWKDKNGKDYVLAGHHRLEAAKRIGKTAITSKYFTGTEAEAIAFAKEESNANRLLEEPYERASIYRKMRADGKSKKEISEALAREGRNRVLVENLSHLNPKGRVINMLKSFVQTSDASTRAAIIKAADWIGAVRRAEEVLTNEHENELYDWLINDGNLNKIVRREDFVSRVKALVDNVGFDPKNPLNIKNKATYGVLETEKRDEIARVSNEIKALEKERSDKKTATTPKRLDEISSEIEKKNKELAKLKSELPAAQEGDSAQTDIFSLINEEVSNGTVTEETVKEFDNKSEESVSRDESAIQAIERKAEVADSLTEEEITDAVVEIGQQLSPKEKSISQTKIKEYAAKVISNREEIRRLSQEAEQGRKQGGIRNVEATLVLVTGGKGNGTIKGRKAQQQAIEDYAKAEDIWFENINDNPEIGSMQVGLGQYVDSGVESLVYLPQDNPNIVRKAMKTTDPFNKNNENEVLYHLDTRISEHNSGIGNSVPYTVVGFGRLANGDFVVITEQPRIKGARLATKEEIRAEMEKMGYEPSGKDSYGDENHFITDVNPKNVLVDKSGNLHFIDTMYDILYDVNDSDGERIFVSEQQVEVGQQLSPPQSPRTMVESEIISALKTNNPTLTEKQISEQVLHSLTLLDAMAQTWSKETKQSVDEYWAKINVTPDKAIAGVKGITGSETATNAPLLSEKYEKQATERISELVDKIFGKKLTPLSSKVLFQDKEAQQQRLSDLSSFKTYKKAYGETIAKSIWQNLPLSRMYEYDLVRALDELIPIKEHIPFILESMGTRVDSMIMQKLGDISGGKESIKTTKTAQELANEAGYDFFETKTEKEAYSFKADFRDGEVLCTFNDVSGRLSRNFIFWLRNKDADNIQPADKLTQSNLSDSWKDYLTKNGRKNEDGTFNLSGLGKERQDPYGTSSMSVQIGKSSGSISIKNRYNHAVGSPDATFGNDLNKIIDGLEEAVYKINNVTVPKQEKSLPNNIISDSSGKLYKYAREDNGIYWGDKFYIDRGIVTRLNDNERMWDGYIINDKGSVVKKISEDELPFDFNRVQFGKNKITFWGKNKDGSSFEVDIKTQNGQSSDVYSETLKTVGNYSFRNNAALTTINMPAVTTVGDGSFGNNAALTTINMPAVTTVGDGSFRNNAALTTINMPAVTTVGDGSFRNNAALTTINMPAVTTVGDGSFRNNAALTTINMPAVTTVGDYSFGNNAALTTINMPAVTTVGDYSFGNNAALTTINMPAVTTVGDDSFRNNAALTTINMPAVTTVGDYSFRNNAALTTINMPAVTTVGDDSFRNNAALTTINMPAVTTVGDGSFGNNAALTTINMPAVTTVGDYSFGNNAALTVSVPLNKIRILNNRVLERDITRDVETVIKKEQERVLKENNVRGVETKTQALLQEQQGAFGSFLPRPDGTTIIGLFKGANATTILHEIGGHYGRRALAQMAQTSPMWAKRYEAVKKWAGVKGENWTVKAEEKFARGFENYVRTGKLPTNATIQLKRAFEFLKEFFANVYKNAKADAAINQSIPQEIIDVFNAMLGIEPTVQELTQSIQKIEEEILRENKSKTTGDKIAQAGILSENEAKLFEKSTKDAESAVTLAEASQRTDDIAKATEKVKKAENVLATGAQNSWVNDFVEDIDEYDAPLFQQSEQLSQSDKEFSLEVVNGFYSPIEKRLLETKITKQSPQKWLAIVGKKEEAQWTGVSDWLQSLPPTQQVSKSEIMDWMRDNRVQVKVVEKGTKKLPNYALKADPPAEFGADRHDLLGALAAAETLDNPNFEKYLENRYGNGKKILGWLKDNVEEVGEYVKEEDTKFSQYQLEGEKDNYKEVLVTMPRNPKDLYMAVSKNGRRDNGDVYKYYEVVRIDDPSQKGSHEVFDSIDDANKKAKSLNANTANQIFEDKSVFKSNHFDEANILVHLRMNTRTDAEGNKVLFLEEIQSDWGQKGKKEGFVSNEAEEATRIENEIRIKYGLKPVDNIIGNDKVPYKEQLKLSGASIKKANAIPTAPFVTDTNSWTKLALKVALKEAVRQGATKIAWTTGEQQNDRYDLSKQVDYIQKDTQIFRDGTKATLVDISITNSMLNFEINPKTGEILGQRGSTAYGDLVGKNLEDVIGKDITKRILEAGESERFEGEGLKVGGKGMKGFYGSPTEGSLGIVGNVAKSLFNQEPKTVWIKGNKGSIDSTSVDAIWVEDHGTILPENKREDYKFNDKEFVFTIDNYVAYRLYDKNDIRDAKNRDIYTISREKYFTQHSIDITPELIGEVQTGLPLFQSPEGRKQTLKDLENDIKAAIKAEQKRLGKDFTHAELYLTALETFENSDIVKALDESIDQAFSADIKERMLSNLEKHYGVGLIEKMGVKAGKSKEQIEIEKTAHIDIRATKHGQPVINSNVLPQAPKDAITFATKISEDYRKIGSKNRSSWSFTIGSVDVERGVLTEAKRIMYETYYNSDANKKAIETAAALLDMYKNDIKTLGEILLSTPTQESVIVFARARELFMTAIGDQMVEAERKGDTKLYEDLAAMYFDMFKVQTQSFSVYGVATGGSSVHLKNLGVAVAARIDKDIEQSNDKKLVLDGENTVSQLFDVISKLNKQDAEQLLSLIQENMASDGSLDNFIRTKTDAIIPDQRRDYRKRDSAGRALRRVDDDVKKNALDFLAHAKQLMQQGALMQMTITNNEIAFLADVVKNGFLPQGYYMEQDIRNMVQDFWTRSELSQEDMDAVLNSPYNAKKSILEHIGQQEKYEALRLYGLEEKKEKKETKKSKDSTSPKPLSATEYRSQINKAIKDIVNAHYSERDDLQRTLVNKLVDDLNISPRMAKDIVQEINDSVGKKIKERAVKQLDSKLKEIKRKPLSEREKKSIFSKVDDAINLGALQDDAYVSLFTQKFGLREKLNKEEISNLEMLSARVRLLNGRGISSAIAMSEMANYMYTLKPKDSGFRNIINLVIAMRYASMLSGVTTHVVNIATAAVNVLSAPILNALSPLSWVSAYRNFNKLSDVNKAALYARYNPLTDLFRAYRDMFAGAKRGIAPFNIVWNQGLIGSSDKYSEIVRTKELIPAELEKNTYGVGQRFKPISLGRFSKGAQINNPYNILKYVGRALYAEDQFMFEIAHTMETAKQLRRQGLSEGLSGKKLEEYINRALHVDALIKEELQQIDEQIGAEIKALLTSEVYSGSEPIAIKRMRDVKYVDENGVTRTGKTMFDENGKIVPLLKNIWDKRRMELMHEMVVSSKETRDSLKQSSRDEIFTFSRHGTMASMADAINRFTSKNTAAKLATMPFVPFTTVLGNIGEYMLDLMPFYGFMRYYGISASHLSRAAMDLGRSGGTFSPRQQQGASLREDAIRGEKQFARAYFGTLLTMVLLAALFDSDDDSWMQVHGSMQHLSRESDMWKERSYSVRFGRGKDATYFKYANMPLFNIIFSLVGSLNDRYVELETTKHIPTDAGMLDFVTEMGVLGTLSMGFLSSVSVLSESTLLEGVRNMINFYSETSESIDKDSKRYSISGLGSSTRKERASMTLRRSLVEVLKNYGQVLASPNPANLNLIQQIMKWTVSANSKEKKSFEGIAWSLLGVSQIVGTDNYGAFGEPVKSFPGGGQFNFLSSYDKNQNVKLYEALADNKFVPYPPSNRMYKQADGEQGYLTAEELSQYTQQVGLIFREKIDEYVNSDAYKIDFENYVKDGNGVMLPYSRTVIAEKRSEALEDAMNAMPDVFEEKSSGITFGKQPRKPSKGGARKPRRP